MEFEAKYYSERLRIVNPSGDVGVVTLWSKVDSAYEVLIHAGTDLSPENSRIAVIANLYGNGLPQMLRNLLYNPQICHIVICGKDLSGSREWLVNFFRKGLEEIEFLGAKAFRIRGTNRVIDGEVTPEHFHHKITFDVFGDLGCLETKTGFSKYFRCLPIKAVWDLVRVDPSAVPEPAITRFPSDPGGHMIVRDTPLEAWRELVFRLYRFGHRNTVAKSTGPETRVELQNVHVVVTHPAEESAEVLEQVGFNLDHFREYGQRILDPVKPQELGYTYGWLLRTGLEEVPVDSLQIIVDRLQKDPESRHAYVTLWNNAKHLPSGKGCPCFVTVFFRKFDGKLTLTATFRAHNAMDAWPENVYGLMSIQRFVADGAQMERGPITVISHSISIDPAFLEKAGGIVREKTTDEVLDPVTGKFGPRFDPNGEFTVTFDRTTWELVVEHSFEGMKLGEYRGKSSEEVELQLSRDVALSVTSHALYLGRELARKEFAMKSERAKQP